MVYRDRSVMAGLFHHQLEDGGMDEFVAVEPQQERPADALRIPLRRPAAPGAAAAAFAVRAAWVIAVAGGDRR